MSSVACSSVHPVFHEVAAACPRERRPSRRLPVPIESGANLQDPLMTFPVKASGPCLARCPLCSLWCNRLLRRTVWISGASESRGFTVSTHVHGSSTSERICSLSDYHPSKRYPMFEKHRRWCPHSDILDTRMRAWKTREGRLAPGRESDTGLRRCGGIPYATMPGGHHGNRS